MISSAGRAPPLQGGGRRFDPVITHHFGSLAQLVEQLTFNQLVAGSNPARPTNLTLYSSVKREGSRCVSDGRMAMQSRVILHDPQLYVVSSNNLSDDTRMGR